MPTKAADIVEELKKLGSATIKKVMVKHGAVEPYYGVKIGDLKVIQKRIKKDHALALELFATGIGDAMYLAALIADPPKMSKKDLEGWVKKAKWSMISDYAVAWVAAESLVGAEVARKWIDATEELVVCAGWQTLSSIVAIKPDEELDLDHLVKLLDRVKARIGKARNRERYVMNAFVIAVGSYVAPLLAKAKEVAKAIGKVDVDFGDTSCHVPLATEYIAKVEKMGRVGKKRKTAMC